MRTGSHEDGVRPAILRESMYFSDFVVFCGFCWSTLVHLVRTGPKIVNSDQ